MKHVKQYKHIFIFGGAAVITLAVFFWLSRQEFFESFVLWSRDNLLLFMIVLIFFKALAIVWPPIPGGLLTLGSVAVIGWGPAYAGQVIGGLLGGSIAYWLGGRYGMSLLSKIFDETTINKVRSVKIYKHREFEAVFFLRIFTTSISEAISYGAGLIGIHYRNFFLATLLGFVFEIPLFYLASSILNGGGNLFLTGALVLVAAFVFYKLKGRYFE